MRKGLIIEEKADYVIVKSTMLEKNLYLNHSASVPVGAQISVAIRPEKVMLLWKNQKVNIIGQRE